MSVYIPDVSIIVCSYNHSRFLERCIRSLNHQIHIDQKSYEIIVVDDGSTDDTDRVLNNYSHIPNLRIIKNEQNVGLPTSLNKAIKGARGRYVVRVDSDDYVARQFLYITMLFLDMNRQYQAVAVDYNIVDNFENSIRKVNCFEEEIACGVMFRTECLFEVGLYDENFKMREGHELRKRFIEKYKMARLEFPLYKYRNHDHNRTKNKSEVEQYDKKLMAEHIKKAKEQVKKYGLSAGNNVNLICEKLYHNPNLVGSYVECGVFQGNTLLTIAEFLQSINQERKIVGFDTFGGFPAVLDYRDRPIFFSELLRQNLITQDHYEKARARTKDFQDEAHLSAEYFAGVGDLFNIAANYKNIELIKGSFQDTLSKYKEEIAILFIDCDLYKSYLECLTHLYDKVVANGIIVFDEYYSHKYPGARWAVEEFFADKSGLFEKYITDDGFERVCFVKEK